MTLDLQQAALLGLLSATLHWIIARSTVMRWFWSRLRGVPATLLACPACSGFWLGLGLGGIGVRPAIYENAIVEVLTAGVLAVFLTPTLQAVLLWALERTAIVNDDEIAIEESPPAPPKPPAA